MPLAKPGLAVVQPDGTYGYAPRGTASEMYTPPQDNHPSGYAVVPGTDVEAPRV